MIALLQFLMFGHLHKWKIIKEARVTWDVGSTGFMYVCQCEKCGKIKRFSTQP